MSVVSVQLGQCGNQVGQELYDVMCSDALAAQKQSYVTASCDRFFRRDRHGGLVARSVLVDMEPKVINQSLTRAARSGRWTYGASSHFSQNHGCGNNWASGFCVHGPRHGDAIEDLVRREVERCDRLAGVVTLMSVAGGTGSGVGTYVTRRLRDSFPATFVLNHLTWPYSSGEVILQNYNSLLTLARLYQLSDAIVVHENDVLHQICSRRLGVQHVSFAHINRVIAHQLGSVLQPVLSADSLGTWSRNPLGELVSAVACHPEYKLLSVSTIPQIASASLAFSTFSWPALLKRLRQMLVSNAKMEEGVATGSGFNTSLANLLVLRGRDVFDADAEPFADASLYTSWLRPPEALAVWKSPLTFDRYEKSAALVSNGQALLPQLQHMLRHAWNMFASRAYIHQYTKFGISEEDFLESFTSLEQVVSSYSRLA